MKHMLDLYSGLGGASEAMYQDTINWSVLRIDNNQLLNNVPNTVIMDIKTLPGQLHKPKYTQDIDLIWASPPCTEFSGGYSSPKSIASRTIGLENYEPDMSLLETAIKIIDIVKPRYWVIENVAGSIRYFREYLGEPRQIIGPYVLWGNFPLLDVDPDRVKKKKHKDTNSRDPLRSNKRAKVDFEISAGLKKAIELQQSILDF